MHIIELGRQISAEERYPTAVPKGPLVRPRFGHTDQQAETAAEQLERFNSHEVARSGAARRGPTITQDDVTRMQAAAPPAPASNADLLARIEALEAANAELRAELDAHSGDSA